MAVFVFLAAIFLMWHDFVTMKGIYFCCWSFWYESFGYTFFLIIAVASASCIWKLMSINRDWFGEGKYYKRLEEEKGVNDVACGLLEEEQNIENVDKLTGRQKEGMLNNTEQVYIYAPVDINSLKRKKVGLWHI